jgi:hypothetical protein
MYVVLGVVGSDVVILGSEGGPNEVVEVLLQFPEHDGADGSSDDGCEGLEEVFPFVVAGDVEGSAVGGCVGRTFGAGETCSIVR